MSHTLLVKDRRGERELALVGRVTIGRDPRCDVSEGDPQLSRVHAEIAVSERGVVARDLESRNGMLVNGRRQVEALLHPGDVVQVGGLAVTLLSSPRSRTTASGMPATAGADDEERELTRLMSADQVAAAAIASLTPPAGEPGAREPARRERALPPAVPEASEPTPAAMPAASSPAAAAARRPRAGGGRLRAAPVGSWTANLTWQVGALAAVSCVIGAASIVPWRAGTAGEQAGTGLLVPSLALLAALAMGLLVAARLRQTALDGLAALTAQVRAVAAGQAERVGDPLGTKPTSELAEAINQALERAPRP